jgi:hypothetical protein
LFKGGRRCSPSGHPPDTWKNGTILAAVRTRLVLGAAAWAAVTGAAFVYLNPVLAAAVAIFGGALVALVVLAADWDQHSTYEDRERARNLRRKEKWTRNADVRARDRARWEAHQARQAGRADAGGES